MRREVMQFIMDNYIWFAVGGIVLIMAIIGYIADKTDFGRKTEEKVKKEKKPKKEKVVEEPTKVAAQGINDLAQTMIEDKEEDNVSLENTEIEVDPSLYEPLVPLSNEEITTEEPVTTLEETVEPISNEEVPASDAMATMELEQSNDVELQPFIPNTIEEPIENDVEETIEPITQPIEPLEQPVQIPASETESAEEEDVWKF